MKKVNYVPLYALRGDTPNFEAGAARREREIGQVDLFGNVPDYAERALV